MVRRRKKREEKEGEEGECKNNNEAKGGMEMR